MIALRILLLLFVQAAETVPVQDAPEPPGVYFSRSDHDRIQLKPAVTENAGASGLQLFVYTDGYTNLSINISCPGPRASLRMTEAKPTFYVRAIGSPEDAMIVRLTKKKDKRIYRTTFSNITVGNKGGFRKKDVFSLIVREDPDSAFSVSPERELPQGEYLLVLGNALPVYDFGVDKKR